MRTFKEFSRSLAVAGMLVLAWSASAQADGYVTFGSQGWEQDVPEAKYQEFREVARGVFVESFLYRDHIWKGHAALWGNHLIRSDEAVGFRFVAPRWRFDVDYTQTPHNLSFVTRNSYAMETDPGRMTLPDSLQKANQENPAAYTSTMTDFLNQANQFNLGFRTDILATRLRGRPGHGLKFELKGSRRNRSGNKAYGGTFGFSNAIEIVEPIRQQMADGEARVSFAKNRVSAEGALGYSAFQNSNGFLVWDNPRTLADVVGTPSKGRLDLYPDNQQWRGSGLLAIRLPKRTVFTGSLSYAQSTQNDSWFPYTINSALFARTDSFPLPNTSTEAKANLTTMDARLTSHPLPHVGGTLRYRENKYDNKTPQWTFAGQVPYDGTWAGNAVESDAFGNTQTVYGVDLDWSPMPKIGLYGTVEQIKRDRTFRESAKDDEKAYDGKVVLRPRAGLDASVRYHHGDRKLDEFDGEDYLNDAGVQIEQPGLRRFDIADRVQDLVDVGVSWSRGERVSLSAAYGYLRNEYADSPMGLRDDLRRSASIDVLLNPTDRVDFSGSFGWAWMYTNQVSRTSGATIVVADTLNWQARLYDELINASGTVAWRVIPDRVALSATYSYERAPGTYRLTSTKLTPPAADLPGTFTMRRTVGVEVRYTLMDNMDVAGRWGWEQFNVADFATENIPLLFPTTGASNAIFLGDSIQDYRATLLALVFQRHF